MAGSAALTDLTTRSPCAQPAFSSRPTAPALVAAALPTWLARVPSAQRSRLVMENPVSGGPGFRPFELERQERAACDLSSR